MTALWKLTTQEWMTRNNTKWGPGVTHKASGRGDLCGPGWLHAYTSPLLAAMLNPMHADITDPVLWRCDGDIGKSDHGLKVGTTKLTTIEIVPLPVVTPEQRVKFAILCALKVYREPVFGAWAERWLSGKDRSKKAADVAAAAAGAAAAGAAAQAAEADAAAWAAEAAAGAAWAAEAGAWAAWAERAAAEAAGAAARAEARINLQELAEEATR